MANSSLEGSFWELTEPLKNTLNRIYTSYRGKKNVEGYQRLENLIKNDKCSYEQMKRIKNFFDSFNGNKNETTYLLNGGSHMKKWVNDCLNNSRESLNIKKNNMKDIGVSNQYQNKKDTDIDRINNSDVKLSENNVETRKIMKEEYIYELERFKETLNVFNKNNKSIKRN